MDRKKKPPPVSFRTSLHGLAYDKTTASEPPVSYKSSPTTETASKQLPATPPTYIGAKLKAQGDKDYKKDWDLASSATSHSRTTISSEDHRSSSITSGPSLPQIRLDNDPLPTQTDSTSKSSNPRPSTSLTIEEFSGLTLDLPAVGMSDLMPTGNVEFSKRGSMLIDGRKINGEPKRMSYAGIPEDSIPEHKAPEKRLPQNRTPEITNEAGLSPKMNLPKVRSQPALRQRPDAKVLSTDEESLSQKVRSYYEAGLDLAEGEWSSATPTFGRKMDQGWQTTLSGMGSSNAPSVSRATSNSDIRSEHSAAPSTRNHRASSIQREDSELAGGVEDWQDIDSADVDRYGFIITRSSTSVSLTSNGGVKRSDTARDPQPLHRVATSLALASETPRRKGTIRRSPSKAVPKSLTPSRQASIDKRPVSSQSSYQGNLSAPTSRLRAATNRLPHNKNRKLLDEAGDMLTLPPSLENIPENGSDQPSVAESRARRKETEREEKWRKMAKVVSKDPAGGGMTFTFDNTSPKLIERTWKGIPDTWRATAWHAFLSASAAKRKGSLSDEALIKLFHEYVEVGSPDDVQIDLDVPRTISSHIMFRRRYRGGQRLLFRVLHAMSLHFPDTGYVQGMAALAASLLAYYEEEKAFVMLVRLWEVRGLGRLYGRGFAGLIEALGDFEKFWLGRGELGAKLENLGIGPTAYGTRWYLTLFNYSIPFAAQLRVWDVFMLLGDDAVGFVPSTHPPPASPPRAGGVSPSAGVDGSVSPGLPTSPEQKEKSKTPPFGTTLDILHATSAALIDGMRGILLEADFEEAMKTLTSWVPVRDEDLFMRVARAEWKVHTNGRR